MQTQGLDQVTLPGTVAKQSFFWARPCKSSLPPCWCAFRIGLESNVNKKEQKLDTGVATTHSDIGFKLTQLPGKMAMERKGGRVSALGMLNKVFCMTAVGQQWKSAVASSAARERFGGVSCKPPTAWSTVWNRYTVGRPPLHQHLLASSSLDAKCQWCPVPLRGNCTMKIQCPWIRGLTHTVWRESALLERGLAVNSLLAGWLQGIQR